MTFRDLPDMIRQPATFEQGMWHLSVRTGQASPLRMEDGQHVVAFADGWEPRLLYTGLAPILILEFQHRDGAFASWYLDASCKRLGGGISDLSPEVSAIVRDLAAPLVRALVDTLLTDIRPTYEDKVWAFLALNEETRGQIGVLCIDLVLPEPRRLDIATLGDELPVRDRREIQPLVSLRRADLEAGFAVDLQDRMIQAAKDGILRWPNPFDGGDMPCSGSIVFDDFHFGYRFVDHERNFVFFVFTAHHKSTPCLFYSRQLNLALGNAWGLHLASVYFGALRQRLVDHLSRWAGLLHPYFNSGRKRLVVSLRGRPGVHIGHLLWNELTGLESLVSEVAKPLLPECIAVGASGGTELYGPVDQIFPELAGSVTRSVATFRDLTRYAYSNACCVCRFTREYVKTSLRERILAVMRKGLGYAAVDARLATQNGGNGDFVVVVGLRVENRTLVDLPAFLHGLVDLIMSVAPDAMLVLDGHNRREGAPAGEMIESFAETLASRSPLAVEEELASDLAAYCRGKPIAFVNNIGAPLASSLAWTDRSSCFVALWGAGLAKYRWVCNKRGFVVTSRTMMTSRGDLGIYHDPVYVESAAEIEFIDPSLAHDDAGAALLVRPSENPHYNNFTVDSAALFAKLDEALRRWRQADRIRGDLAIGP